MNKRLLVGIFSAFMAMTPLSGYTAQTIDSPHVNLDKDSTTDDCTYCHFANYQPSDCLRCHKTDVAPFDDTTAPLAMTHKGLKCEACHNPHVSLQDQTATPIASGSFTGVGTYNATTGTTTLTGVTPAPQASWAQKSGNAERGLIMFITGGTDRPSYEIKAVDTANSTITVKGNVTAAGSFVLHWGQLIAKKVTSVAGNSYLLGDKDVTFPASVDSRFVDPVTKKGICQVCHTATTHWDANGTNTTEHNPYDPLKPEQTCVSCHQHSSGFMVTACNACHTGVGLDGAPTDLTQLAKPTTGSGTAGMHSMHVGGGSGYSFACSNCHVGTKMDRINDPKNPVYQDGIQVGFSVPKLGGANYEGYLTAYKGQAGVIYQGTNKTKVTNDGALNAGTMTCSNVYCHSNGKSLKLQCNTALLNTSPAWDGSSADPQGDTVKCNNCHGFDKNIANRIVSGKHPIHVNNLGLSCFYCHAETAEPNGASSQLKADKSKHVNGSVDILGSGEWAGPITINWNRSTAGVFTCSSVIGCHTDSRIWSADVSDTETCPNACVDLDGVEILNDDPILNLTAVQVSSNTIEFTDASVDPDRADPVKAQCLTYNSLVGHNNPTKKGSLTIQKPIAGGKFPFPGGGNQDGTVRKGLWVINDPAQYNTINVPGQTNVYYMPYLLDNDPQTVANLTAKTYLGGKIVNGKVVDKLHDGMVYGRTDANGVAGKYFNIVWNTNFDDSNVNVLPTPRVIPDVVALGGGSYKLTFTSAVIDPDAYDLTKNAKFGGHGHDKTSTQSRLKYFWNDAANVTKASPAISVVFDNTVATPAPYEVILTGFAPGGVIWYQVQVWDAHVADPIANAAFPSSAPASGYQTVPVP